MKVDTKRHIQRREASRIRAAQGEKLVTLTLTDRGTEMRDGRERESSIKLNRWRQLDRVGERREGEREKDIKGDRDEHKQQIEGERE